MDRVSDLGSNPYLFTETHWWVEITNHSMNISHASKTRLRSQYVENDLMAHNNYNCSAQLCDLISRLETN